MPIPARQIYLADLEIDLRTQKARRGGQEIVLTRKEFILLELLALHVGKFVDRGTIAEYIWKDAGLGRSNQLEVLVRRLRRKLDDTFEPKLVHTRRGAGYALSHLSSEPRELA